MKQMMKSKNTLKKPVVASPIFLKKAYEAIER